MSSRDRAPGSTARARLDDRRSRLRASRGRLSRGRLGRGPEPCLIAEADQAGSGGPDGQSVTTATPSRHPRHDAPDRWEILPRFSFDRRRLWRNRPPLLRNLPSQPNHEATATQRRRQFQDKSLDVIRCPDDRFAMRKSASLRRVKPTASPRGPVIRIPKVAAGIRMTGADPHGPAPHGPEREQPAVPTAQRGCGIQKRREVRRGTRKADPAQATARPRIRSAPLPMTRV